MKRIGKILSLLLAAVMLLVLLPHAAKADPPQNDPTHRHNWVVTSNQKATCTEAGKKTWRCTACGKTYTETYKALGHDWDEGAVTTEPHLFTPGVRTYTCKRDHSHTYTEEIDPAPWLFATLEGVEMDFETFDVVTKDLTPIVITEQPTGGSITRWEDETAHLTCAATGGTGDYTYEWYSKKMYKLWGWNWPNYYGEQTEPGFDASDADYKYWCVVTDSAGNTAVTDYAEVTYKVRIAKQPDDVNLQSENTSFYCEAEDGSGSYTYRWYDSDMGILGEGQSLPATEHGICYCYCIVTDDVTGEKATSEYCEVYSEPPFRLVSISGDCELVPGASAELIASFADGTKDYEIWWDKDGTAIDSVEGTDAEGNVISCVDTAEAGVYTVHGVDAHGETVKASVVRTDEKLTITEQPQGGMIPKDSYTRINVVVADGEAPYTFILYRNGEECLTETDDSDSCPYGVWDPGEYYYHIEDSQGRSVDSDVVYFENAVFRVKKQTESAEIAKPDGTAKLEVEVEGGAEPYTYEWTVGSAWSWFKTGANEPTLTAKKPGYYSCRIKDKDGDCIKSKTIRVSYTGKKPWILSVTPDRIIGVGETTKLTCTAISGTGDDSNLRYDWYSKKPDGGWTLFAANAQTTETAFAWQYRCKVTDTVSGEYSTSEITTVSEELVLTDIIKYKELKSQSFTLYTLSFRGGTAPYACTVYLKYPYWNGTATEYKDVIEDIFIVNSLEELKQREWFSPLENHVWYIENTPIGERYAVEYAQHYLVIYDASGQKVKSPIFTYRDS